MLQARLRARAAACAAQAACSAAPLTARTGLRRAGHLRSRSDWAEAAAGAASGGMDVLAVHRAFGGAWLRMRTAAPTRSTGVPHALSVYLPPAALHGADLGVPALYWLSGLTCTDENFVVKAGAARAAAQHHVALVVPDTSPRGDGVPDDEAYDMGQGAGFYVDATASPWSTNFRMYSLVQEELPQLLRRALPQLSERRSVSGHSMGGHGALVVALRCPEAWCSVSALAPIAHPSAAPWGRKAFNGYFADPEAEAPAYDATLLMRERSDAAFPDAPVLVDTGTGDEFLEEQLAVGLREFEKACDAAGQPLRARMQPGYDHSYHFVSTFINDHVEAAARALYA